MYMVPRSCRRCFSLRNIALRNYGSWRSNFAEQSSGTETIRQWNESSLLNEPFNSPYFEWTEGDYHDAPSDLHTKCRAEAPLITRSNAGMGFLVLNRLADLETNVYKRFVVVTSMSRDTFSYGIHPLELLMFKDSLQLLNSRADGAALYRVIQKALDDYLSNVCDMSSMIQSYKKPLIVYANGLAAGLGVCLVSLANVSACYKHSRMRFNNLELGAPLLGGQSYVLSMLRGSLGEYLVLTGKELVGSNLVWAGIVKRYISPDALAVMQMAAERLVDMPEKETEFQIQEHFMPLDGKYSLEKLEWLIHEHFRLPSLSAIMNSLEKGIPIKKVRSQSFLSENAIREWEMDTLYMIRQNIKNGEEKAETILKLVRDVKAYKLAVLKRLDISPSRWNELQRFTHIPVVNTQDHNNREVLHAIQQEVLLESLQSEVSSFLKTTEKGMSKDNGNLWELSKFSKHPFTPFYRSGFSLSSLPGLRALHPDYDARTGSDHDAVRMSNFSERWSDDFLQREFMLMKRILT